MGRIVLSKEPEVTRDMKIELENGMFANLFFGNGPSKLNYVIVGAALKANIDFKELFACVVNENLKLKPEILDDEKCKKIVNKNFNLKLNSWLQIKGINQFNASQNDIEEAFRDFEKECAYDVRDFLVSLFYDELIKEILEYYYKHKD